LDCALCAKESGEATSVIEVSLNCTFLLEQGEGIEVKQLLKSTCLCSPHCPQSLVVQWWYLEGGKGRCQPWWLEKGRGLPAGSTKKVICIADSFGLLAVLILAAVHTVRS